MQTLCKKPIGSYQHSLASFLDTIDCKVALCEIESNGYHHNDLPDWVSFVTGLNVMQHQARAFAIAAHAEQMYGDRPYSFHLDAVAALSAPYGEEAVVVAFLHDTVEDTPTTIAEISNRFGPRIAACVALLTDEPGANRQERKAQTYAKLASVHGPDELALLVKTADRLANVRTCVQDRNMRLWKIYQSEQLTFKTSAYRSGQCDSLWSELESLLCEGAFDAGS